ncbi:hypothetical protein LOD99_904 [Oopsacas minuta]|uniref:Uncharacterized protein n=1 Tax=Oopsacas minuta TaxID=111878 RepID=A0AAV7JZW0_9METZ|nr:hypothetical protein LOD99_904 [Oopsacas minuta]
MPISPSVPLDGKVPAAVSRKRQHPQLVTSIDDDTKRILISKEDEKLVLLREIKENLVSIGNVLQLLPEMVQNQTAIVNLLAQQLFPFVAPSRFPTNFPPSNVP